jgi:hypothetical protein
MLVPFSEIFNAISTLSDVARDVLADYGAGVSASLIRIVAPLNSTSLAHVPADRTSFSSLFTSFQDT